MCCLMPLEIILSRHFLYLLYLCMRICLGLFISYLFDPFFISIFIFIIINNVVSLKRMQLLFRTLLFFQLKFQPQDIVQLLFSVLQSSAWCFLQKFCLHKKAYICMSLMDENKFQRFLMQRFPAKVYIYVLESINISTVVYDK